MVVSLHKDSYQWWLQHKNHWHLLSDSNFIEVKATQIMHWKFSHNIYYQLVNSHLMNQLLYSKGDQDHHQERYFLEF